MQPQNRLDQPNTDATTFENGARFDITHEYPEGMQSPAEYNRTQELGRLAGEAKALTANEVYSSSQVERGGEVVQMSDYRQSTAQPRGEVEAHRNILSPLQMGENISFARKIKVDESGQKAA